MSNGQDRLDLDVCFVNELIILEAYAKILNGDVGTYVRRGKVISPSAVLCDPERPNKGIERKVLPSHISRVVAYEMRPSAKARVAAGFGGISNLHRAEIRVSFCGGFLDRKKWEDYWREKGYPAQNVNNRTLEVGMIPGRGFMVTYGNSRIRVRHCRLTEFVENAIPIDPSGKLF